MNPFSGFMQAVTGLVPEFGDKNYHIGKGLQGLPIGEGSILSADENTGSFLAWVQDFMENTVGEDADGESVFNFQPSDLDPDLPALDQLQALMGEARELFSEGQPVPHPLNGENLDNAQVPLPQGMINAIIVPHEGKHSTDSHTHEALPDVPEGTVAKENTPAFGQLESATSGTPSQAGQTDDRQNKENTPAHGQLKSAASGIPSQARQADDSQIKENTPAHGQLKPSASGIPTQAGKIDDSQSKESSPEWVMKENRPEEGFEKGGARALAKPLMPAGDEGQIHTHRLIQERLPSGLGIVGKAADPATPQLQPVASQTKDPESMASGLTGQQSASSEDDAANFRGKDPHHPAQRVALAEVIEEEWQKGQSSDAVKNTVPEQTKSHPSFQETAKAMAGDPTTNPAIKPTTGQATASTRTEGSAVKTFQTTVMDQIVDKAAMRSIHGRSEIQIRLKPEFLGNVQMNIAADRDQLVVRIMTDRPVVKEIIETHLHHLKTELQSQGLTIDKFEVMVNPDTNQQHSRDQFAQMFKHQSSHNGQRRQQEQDPETLNRDGGNNPDDGQPNRDGVNYFA